MLWRRPGCGTRAASRRRRVLKRKGCERSLRLYPTGDSEALRLCLQHHRPVSSLVNRPGLHDKTSFGRLSRHLTVGHWGEGGCLTPNQGGSAEACRSRGKPALRSLFLHHVLAYRSRHCTRASDAVRGCAEPLFLQCEYVVRHATRLAGVQGRKLRTTCSKEASAPTFTISRCCKSK